MALQEPVKTSTTLGLPKRKERVPVGDSRDLLAVQNQDPNYVYRWVNDLPGRIERFKLGGYEVVTGDAVVGQSTVDRNTRLGSAVTKTVGGTLTAVLMRIPREWFEEDQKAKQAKVDEQESAVRKADSDYGDVTISRKHR